MNYLAHAYLSFNQPEVLVGNIISDFIKGKKQFDYPLAIQKGIQLHRAIDTFTDTHPVTKLLKSYFQVPYRLYSGAFADIVYDHFLAIDKTIFKTEENLHSFTQQVYFILENNVSNLPDAFKNMLPYMKKQNWLYHYQYKEGIQKSFGGLVRRAVYLTESDIAFALFNKNYKEMKDCYHNFFPHLHKFAAHKFKELLSC
jgi:acyl carrier protein phosphodiesterase